MKLVVLYREQSDHARLVTEFVEMLSRRFPGKSAELIDIDTQTGAQMAATHGVMRYPAFLVTTYEGRLVNQWEGEPLPLIDEVGGMIDDQPQQPQTKIVEPIHQLKKSEPSKPKVATHKTATKKKPTASKVSTKK